MDGTWFLYLTWLMHGYSVLNLSSSLTGNILVNPIKLVTIKFCFSFSLFPFVNMTSLVYETSCLPSCSWKSTLFCCSVCSTLFLALSISPSMPMVLPCDVIFWLTTGMYNCYLKMENCVSFYLLLAFLVPRNGTERSVFLFQSTYLPMILHVFWEPILTNGCRFLSLDHCILLEMY